MIGLTAASTQPRVRDEVRREALDFHLPAELAAREPPEARGLRRDQVRLMVSHLGEDRVEHARFDELARFLRPGDLLVVNRSATLEASLPARRASGSALRLHLSTREGAGRWTVELRRLSAGVEPPADGPHEPLFDAQPGDVIALPAGFSVALDAPVSLRPDGGVRLWHADFAPALDGPALFRYLARYGAPIRYSYVRRAWPLTYYRTLFADAPGSAEMPSASRPFSAKVLDRVARRGVEIARVLLHTGVSSFERGERPQPEYFEVGAGAAAAVQRARDEGRRVIAVGTTAVRAIESAADSRGQVHAARGMTDLIVTPERGLRLVDGLITGLHEPRASHLDLLEAVAGRSHLAKAYSEAISRRYLWHEFGDTHLLGA